MFYFIAYFVSHGNCWMHFCYIYFCQYIIIEKNFFIEHRVKPLTEDLWQQSHFKMFLGVAPMEGLTDIDHLLVI